MSLMSFAFKKTKDLDLCYIFFSAHKNKKNHMHIFEKKKEERFQQKTE